MHTLRGPCALQREEHRRYGISGPSHPCSEVLGLFYGRTSRRSCQNIMTGCRTLGYKVRKDHPLSSRTPFTMIPCFRATEMTASEPLTLEQEYEMQESWREDENSEQFRPSATRARFETYSDRFLAECTFIVFDASKAREDDVTEGVCVGAYTLHLLHAFTPRSIPCRYGG